MEASRRVSASTRGPRPSTQPDEVPSAEEGRSGSRIRTTLDLSREQHRFLRQFALDADSDASSVLRALLALLEEDPELAKTVLTRLVRKYVR